MSKENEVITTSFMMELTPDTTDFLKMVTGKDDVQEAAEIFGVSCVCFHLDPVEILKTVENACPGYEFIGSKDEKI